MLCFFYIFLYTLKKLITFIFNICYVLTPQSKAKQMTIIYVPICLTVLCLFNGAMEFVKETLVASGLPHCVQCAIGLPLSGHRGPPGGLADGVHDVPSTMKTRFKNLYNLLYLFLLN